MQQIYVQLFPLEVILTFLFFFSFDFQAKVAAVQIRSSSDNMFKHS